LEAVGKPLVVQAEQVKDRGLQVVDMYAILGNVEAQVVGCARVSPGFRPAPVRNSV
jgi:hypothetical protein